VVLPDVKWGVALIELDLYAPPESAPGPRPPGRHRWVLLGLAFLLVLTLAGAAPATSTLWWRTGVVPIVQPAGSYQIIGGRLFTFDAGGTTLVTSAWSMDPLRRLWRRDTRIQAVGQSGTQPGLGWSISPGAGDDVLLQTEQTTTAVDARTGRVRWSRPEIVRPLADGRTGLVYQQKFQPGTEYDQAKGAEGPLYFADDGVFHTEPPVRTTLLALDLRTGREQWRSGLSGPAVAVGAPGDPATVLVVASTRLELLDTGTGAVLRDRALDGPTPRDLSEGDILDGLVLVRHGTPGNGGAVTAYSTRTLAPLWRRPEPIAGGPAFCDAVLCDYGSDGVAVLDPATGRQRWQTAGAAGLVARGSEVIEMASGGTRPLRVRDAVTGAVRVDLAQWTYATVSSPNAPLVVGHIEGGRSVFGVLPAGGHAVEPLGFTTTPVADCASDDRFVVCRVIEGAEVWAYRAGPDPAHNG
jgi:outer membrane protein assembly factor BamB